MKAERSDLFSGGPTLLAPEEEMEVPGEAHETALAMEMAKHHLQEVTSGTVSPSSDATSSISTPSTTVTTPDGGDEETGALRTTDKYAFAFDIDGVLIRGGQVIPEAIEAMKVLNGQNEYRTKV